MNGPDAAIAAISEILMWAGLGGAALFGTAALIAKLTDGTWHPVRAVIMEDPTAADPAEREVVRWFGEDGVHEAPLTPELRAAAEGDEVQLHHRVGSRDDVRLHAHSPWPALLSGVALACGGVGALAIAAQIATLLAG